MFDFLPDGTPNDRQRHHKLTEIVRQREEKIQRTVKKQNNQLPTNSEMHPMGARGNWLDSGKM
jgi:tRNA A37 N6-isopentenylltransferase MiaA